MKSQNFLIARVKVDQILTLRHLILRRDLPFETATFAGDEEPSTWHFAVFHDSSIPSTEPIGCASFMLNSWIDQPAWQLRGMAIALNFQNLGVGKFMLNRAEKTVSDVTGIFTLWCNARLPAVKFYQKQNWIVASEIFDIPTAGPHQKMFKEK